MSYEKMKPEDIRRHKGKSFVGVTTVAICHDGNGRYFLNKRGENARDEKGRWDVCGGGLKVGFTAEENCIREVEEEYGTTPIKVDSLGYRELFGSDVDGAPTHWIGLYFLVEIDPNEARRNEPDIASEVGWFKLGEFPQPRHSQLDADFEVFKDALK